MLSKEQIGKSSIQEDRHLYVVGSSNKQNGLERKRCITPAQPDLATVRHLTHAIMNRLGIPHSTTIVGLLNVGLSRSNYEELSKWVVFQITTLPTSCLADKQAELERRFCQAIDRYPIL